jgi:DNA-binding NarL/FixJ family response regulator
MRIRMKAEQNTIRILLSDDHSLLREGIISLLKNEKDLLIVGEAANGQELIEKYFQLKPDLIITDIKMPVMNGTDAVKKISQGDPNVKALFLSMHEGSEYIYYTYRAGGSGLINKNIVKGELIYAIRTILEGGLYFGPGIDSKKLDEIIRQYENTGKNITGKFSSYDLTPREIEILNLIGEGNTSLDIAKKFDLSKRTVDSHRSNLMQKLNLKSLPELMRFAVTFNQSFKEKE